MKKKRNILQKMLDFVSFPLRAICLFQEDKWGMSSLATERYYYAAERVQGFCLDVGCGKHNRFVKEFLNEHGRGIDVYPYEGLSEEQIVDNISRFPFADSLFDSITFLANINHILKPMRDIELAEAYRCLKTGGNVIVTMGNPLAEIIVHKLVGFYDRHFGTRLDVDGERGMKEGEEYFLLDSEIIARLLRVGFRQIKKKYFFTQWCLNHMLIAVKPRYSKTVL